MCKGGWLFRSLPFGIGMEARRAGVVVVTTARVVDVVVEYVGFGFDDPDTTAKVAAVITTHAATPLPIAILFLRFTSSYVQVLVIMLFDCTQPSTVGVVAVQVPTTVVPHDASWSSILPAEA
jgi:hypothetical protein